MEAVRELSLSGTWELRDEPIDCRSDQHKRIARLRRGWIPTPIPGDVRQGLIAAGKMSEPLEGLNSFDGHWVEDRSWWLRKVFRVPAAVRKAQVVELVLDGLDVHASVFLNGVHLGDHPSAFRPFVVRVDEHLVPGENVLLVRLTHGLEDIDPAEVDAIGGIIPTEAGRGRPERGDPRRVFVRKPQFSWGWDWSPRVATVGIAAAPRVVAMDEAVIRDVRLAARPVGLQDVRLDVTVTAEWLDLLSSGSGAIEVTVRDPDGEAVGWAVYSGMLQIGRNHLDLSVPVRDARLWWPAGMGGQDRYTVEVTLRAAGGAVDRRVLRYGIRFIELETDGVFAFRVNGVRLFAKGANWIPPDALWARPTDETFDALVAEAARANFNMLRIWGGGMYNPESFYEACDREGILVFHDFMFACAPYPDHLEWFRDEVAKEADYQTRRLRHHACMAVWSGSNECHFFLEWAGRCTERVTRLLGEVLPEAVRRNCPEIPYWYSSPAGGRRANDTDVGDCHYWGVMMNERMDVRITPEEFDRFDPLFVSEFGYPGPCVRETTEQYLAGAPFRRDGEVWQHHNNTFEKDTVDAGIAKHFADPASLSPEEYLLYGGLTQGLMYAYELESLRANPRCHGGLFWMYNDSWGEVGWTVIDYYLRRKISWYFVRRAFAPRRLILRPRGPKVAVTLVNDTPRAVRGQVELGYVSLDGEVRDVGRERISVDASSRAVVATFGRGRHDPAGGVWFARMVGDASILPATLRAAMPRDLATAAKLTVQVAPADGAWDVTVRSDRYARAVELVLPAGAVGEDNYFDLLPGQSRSVRVQSRRRLTARNVSAECR